MTGEMCNIFTCITLVLVYILTNVNGQVCPYGWMDRARGDSCYLVERKNLKYTWTEGRAKCQQMQASLFKLETVQERDWLMRTLRNMTAVYSDVQDWWSGVYNKGDGKGWIWAADDLSVDNSIISWAGESVPPNDGQKHCADVDGQTFNSTNCNMWKRIICERLKSTPLVCNTDAGWMYSNGSCYKFWTSKLTWDDASDKCQQQSAHLSYVSGEDSQRFVWDLSRTHQLNAWVGLKSAQSGSSVTWNWDQGTSLGSGVTYWNKDNPGTIATKNQNSTCVELAYGARRKQSWIASLCSAVKAFICQKPQGICANGWLQHQDMCFSFNPLYTLPWDQAQNYCTSQGGKLLQLTSASDQKFINLYMKEQTLAGIHSLWVGLTDNNKDGGSFVWGDGSTIGPYKNWAPQNPTNNAGVQDCGYIDTIDSSGRWQTSSDCLVPRSFVCMISVNTVVKPVTTPVPSYNCDAGWLSHSNMCYSFNDTDSTWLESRDNCKASGGDLATIPDKSTQEFLNGHIKGADFWIGLQDRSKEKQFGWIDGTTQLVFTNWNKGEPNNMGSENCVGILGNWGESQFGKWNDYACSKKYNFICQKNANNDQHRTTPMPTVKPVLSKKCGAFWEEAPSSDYCYQFNTDLLSWTDARDMCAHHGGQLVSITSVQEQFYIAGRVSTVNVVAMWLGANDRSSEGGWRWDDGSPFAYMNWSPGEPNDWGKSEDCGIIKTQTGKWNDYDCVRRNGYICKKLGNIQATTVQPSTSPLTVPAGQVYGCPGGWKPYMNACYLVVTTQVSWSQARTQCRKAGGDLASVANKPENQFINSQIQREKCVNVHSNDTECQGWAERGECQKNPLWMAENCRDACALCEYVCADKHTMNECGAWADMGECRKNPSWMHVHCAMSCGRCKVGLNQGVWLGLNDLKTTNSFVWTDGTPNTYTNWARNEPNNYQGLQEDCVVLYTYGAEWNDDLCDTPHGYVCKTNKKIMATTQKSPFAVGCSNGGLGYQHYCYQFNYGPLTWQAAEVTCRLRKGHLATVNDYVIQSFLASELTSRSDVYWIGLSDKTTPGTYTWSSGDKLLYTPWDKSHNGSERSTCVVMRTTKPTGLWQNLNCNTIKPFICQTPRVGFTPGPTTPTPTTAVPLPCASGWYGYKSFCYKAYRMGSSQRKTWAQAVVYCQGLGGDLMSIHSKDQENFIETTLLKYFYNGNFWVGLSDRTKEGSYRWSDGTPFDYSNWYRGEPNNSGGDEDCAEFNQFTRQWNDNTCSASKDFICQIPRGVTVPTTTVQTTTPIISCAGSEKGWDYYNGYCYYISPSYGVLAKKTWYEARRYCMAEGGDLVSIHNTQENNYLTAIITKRSQGIFWIGFNQLGRDNYYWSDGTKSDFLKWRPGEPNDAFGGQLCVDMYGGTISGPGSWNDDNCMDSNNYICKRSNGTLSTVTPGTTQALTGGCPPSFSLFGNKCFAVGGVEVLDRMNWTDARDQCRRQGKGFDIASINSYNEQAFLLVQIKSQGLTTPLWIGMNDRYQNGHYEWQDNTEVTYTNWNKGEPSDHYSYSKYNRQDCVTMYTTGDSLGRWNDDKCSEKRGYICQTFRNSKYAKPTPTTSTCKANYSPFGTSCYRVVTSPTTWQAGQTACKADGGNLLSISDLYEQSFVDILVTNNNIAGGFWLGLSDKKTSGIYGWYGGWPVTYTRWGKGEPSRNAGEGCVAQMGRDWNDTICSQDLPFICEINSATPPPTTPMPPGFCPDKTTVAHGEFCYYAAPTERKSWPEANFLCHQKSMELVSVHDKGELDFLKTLLEQQTTTPRYSYYFNRPNVWIGLIKSKSGGFAWSDGSPANYFNWNQGEPSDVNGTHHENCVEYYRNNKVWNDVDCFQDRAFICKTPKTIPTTTPPTTTTTPSTTTTTTMKPSTANANTQKISTRTTHKKFTFKHGQTFGPGMSLPTGVPKPVFQNPRAPSKLNGGEIAGILVGAIAFIALVVIVLFVIKRRRTHTISSPENGFSNALYSKESEDVAMANGVQTTNHYESGVPSEADA